MKKIWTAICRLLFGKKEQAHFKPIVDEQKKSVATNQRKQMVNLLRNQKSVILSDAKTSGINRATKIVNELRKEGWHIRTNYGYENGKKVHTIYTLITEPHPIGI